MKKIYRIILALLTMASAFNASSQDIESVVKAKPFEWSGAIGANFSAFPVRGNAAGSSNYHYGLFGNFNFRFYETFELPIAFNYNQFGLNVDKPFYQFGISPKYKWVQLHLGHRTMHFSNYTLSGHTFWGAGIELNPGKFRFSAMKGRLKEPVLVDAITGQELLNPQFRRNGWGAKIGVGTYQNYFDLMLFRAADDTESIANWQDSLYQNSISGTTGRFAPAENILVGISTKLTFFKRVMFSLDGGASIYTSDMTSENLIEPIKLFTPKTTSTFSWAGKTSLSFPVGPLNFVTAYERIMPEYYTMGSYNIVNDMENITISPSGSFLNGRFSFSGLLGSQRNNLLGTRSETTKRIISNFNALIAPKPHYGLNISYTNFTFNQQAQAIVLNDSILIRQVNSSVTVMPYFNIIKDTARHHNIHFAFISQIANDLNPVTRDFGSLKSLMFSGNYAYILTKGYSFSTGLNHTIISNPLIENTLTGVSLGATRSISEKGISFNLTSQINSTSVNGQSDGMIFNTGAGGSMNFADRHQMRINLNWMRSTSKQFESYSEIVFQMGYTYRIK